MSESRINAFLKGVKRTFFISGTNDSLERLVAGGLSQDDSHYNIRKNVVSNFRKLMMALCDLNTSFTKLSTEQKICVEYITKTILNSLTNKTTSTDERGNQQTTYTVKNDEQINTGLEPIIVDANQKIGKEIINALKKQKIPNFASFENPNNVFVSNILVNFIRYDREGITATYSSLPKYFQGEVDIARDGPDVLYLVCVNPYISDRELDKDGKLIPSLLVPILDEVRTSINLSDLHRGKKIKYDYTSNYDHWKIMKNKLDNKTLPSYYYKKILPNIPIQLTILHNTRVLPTTQKYYLPTQDELEFLYPFIPNKYKLIFYRYLQRLTYINKPIKMSYSDPYERIKLLFKTIIGGFYEETKVNELSGIVEGMSNNRNINRVLFSNLIVMFLVLCTRYNFLLYVIDDKEFIPCSVISIIEYTIRTTKYLIDEVNDKKFYSPESLMSYIFMSYNYAHYQILNKLKDKEEYRENRDEYKQTIHRPYLETDTELIFLYDVNYIPINDVKFIHSSASISKQNVDEMKFASQFITFDIRGLNDIDKILDDAVKDFNSETLKNIVKTNIKDGFEDFPVLTIILKVDTDGDIEMATPAAGAGGH